ncbi:McrB family protein [Segatella bryantii]|uniref:Endonuclease n=1 Tax=Segatella bryantii TaxID=77095 RepID=A0ABX4EG35_SEGBR|nr:AAA family ATPase [Segatella bryantii]OYP54159.1 endonuclease [Segatella bryantii]UKK80040.1 AAA family ATPase [Segatella bryantii]
MNLKDIVTLFKNHQIQYGLNGDSNLEELYKWELVSKQNGHPDPNAVDFSKEIKSLVLKNLCYSSQITAIRSFAKYEPEEYRKLFKALFDENISLQERIEKFTDSCKTLWDDKIKARFSKMTRAMCDERLISCFLTLHNPQKYTFYKDDVYKNLCELLEIKSQKTGHKLVHFYELLEQYVIPEIEKEEELIFSINNELKKNGCIQSMPLTAQTVLWYHRELLKNTGTDNKVIESKLVDTKIDNDQKYIDLLKESKNLVLTGAPGTGKTFMAQTIAREMGCGKNEMCFVQFHPSYDYTDFVEGLRPIMMSDGQMGFERKDGIFKEFCKKAIKNLEDSKKTLTELSEEKSLNDKYNTVIDKINNGDLNEFKLKTNGKSMEVVKVTDFNNIELKTPGTSSNRTYTVSFDRLAKLAKVFTTTESLNNISNISDAVRDAIGGCHASAYWAVLKEVYKQKNISTLTASNVVKKDFVFIIDEINRGEASKIFGELFYAIDPGYRGKNDIRVKTQYQNLVPETDVFAEGFYIPENVFILGTMNDIDRSIESMDFAMRRRFTWKEIKPEDTQSMLDTLECATKAKSVMARLNNEISKIEGLGPAYQVGPSYFLKLSDNGGNFEKLWDMNIEPLLREYSRGFRKSDEIMEKLRSAYFDTKESNSKINDNELVDEN